MTRNLMYSFVSDKRPNPLGGKCYGCTYCYIHGHKSMKTRFRHIRDKYSGDFKLYPKILERLTNIRSDKPVFFCDCIDYMHKDNPIENIIDIFYNIRKNRYGTTFLSVTKNPIRYIEYTEYIPDNMILGATIESDMNYPEYSNAPSQLDRLGAMIKLNKKLDKLNMSNKTFLSIEPILKFTHDFLYIIKNINPTYGVAIGYDNHHHKLKEPSLDRTMALRTFLLIQDKRVFDKSLRKAWWEE